MPDPGHDPGSAGDLPDTLPRRVQHESVVNRSRFLAIAGPAPDPEAALAFIAEHSVADATHNCWAYRIGQQYRFNDDGEPGGTAGRPILAAIDGQGFDQVVVLVVRWFGGIKLGAGGLVRAYGGCAAECLRQAPRQPLVPQARLDCRVDFALETAVRALLPDYQAEVAAQDYRADGLHLGLVLPASQAAALRARITDVSRGQADFAPSTGDSDS